MKSKFLSYIMILCLIVTSISLIPTKALYPQPRVDLDEYNINVTSNTNVYVEGTVSKSYGQQISVRDTYFIPIALGEVGNSGGKESFKIKIPSAYIKSESNTFYVYSEAVKGKLARSNSKMFIVNYNTGKQSQTITASNKSVEVGKVISLGARASSGLPLSYKSSNTSIATVDTTGKVVGRKVGSTKITISQDGNSQYNAVSKTIIVTVTKADVTVSSKVSIKKTSIKNIKSKYAWENKKVQPEPQITYKNKRLVKNKDYTVSYKNHKEPGKATIYIKGKGNYTDTVNKKYNIYIGATTKIKPKKSKKSRDYKKTITLNGTVYKIYGQGGYYYSSWRWGKNNNKWVKGNGCGPRAIAIIMSGHGYNKHTGAVAKDATKLAKKNGNYDPSGKGGWAKYVRHYGFKAVVHTNIKESDATAKKNITKALKKGHYIWLQVGKGSKKWRYFTGSGFHNIALLSIDSTGKYAYVANSSGSKKGWCKIDDLSKGRLKYKNRSYGYIEIWKPIK